MVMVSASLAIWSIVALQQVFIIRSPDQTIDFSYSVSTAPYFFNDSVRLLPSYFSSFSEVSVCAYSKYATAFQILETRLSLDNKTWVNVPYLQISSAPDNSDSYTTLGTVLLDKPTIVTIYGWSYLPPQNLTLPPGVTEQMLYDSLNVMTRFRLMESPRDTVLKILVGVSLFSAYLGVMRLFRDEWAKSKLE
jgi:hypothetical protein